MKVLLRVDALAPPLTGIGRYTHALATGLKQHPEIESLRYVTATGLINDVNPLLDCPSTTSRARRGVPLKPLARRVHAMRRNWRLKRSLAACCDHVYHAPNYMLTPFAGPSVSTVHDLSHINHPEFHPANRIAFFNKEFPRTLRQATHFITVSEFVRQEMIQLLGVAPERVTVVYNGVYRSYRPRSHAELGPVLEKYGLVGTPYLLVVATLEPRKNLERLLDAFDRLPARLRERHPLVLVGRRGWHNEELDRRLARFQARGQARHLGYIPEQELPLIYAGSHAFAFPSIYEGFGIPIIEAMASGVPVLTSDSSAMPEVAGGAALLTPPDDVEVMTSALERLLDDPQLRHDLATRGMERASLFSWQRCVEETVAVYRKIC